MSANRKSERPKGWLYIFCPHHGDMVDATQPDQGRPYVLWCPECDRSIASVSRVVPPDAIAVMLTPEEAKRTLEKLPRCHYRDCDVAECTAHDKLEAALDNEGSSDG